MARIKNGSLKQSDRLLNILPINESISLTKIAELIGDDFPMENVAIIAFQLRKQGHIIENVKQGKKVIGYIRKDGVVPMTPSNDSVIPMTPVKSVMEPKTYNHRVMVLRQPRTPVVLTPMGGSKITDPNFNPNDSCWEIPTQFKRN